MARPRPHPCPYPSHVDGYMGGRWWGPSASQHPLLHLHSTPRGCHLARPTSRRPCAPVPALPPRPFACGCTTCALARPCPCTPWRRGGGSVGCGGRGLAAIHPLVQRGPHSFQGGRRLAGGHHVPHRPLQLLRCTAQKCKMAKQGGEKAASAGVGCTAVLCVCPGFQMHSLSPGAPPDVKRWARHSSKAHRTHFLHPSCPYQPIAPVMASTLLCAASRSAPCCAASQEVGEARHASVLAGILAWLRLAARAPHATPLSPPSSRALSTRARPEPRRST